MHFFLTEKFNKLFEVIVKIRRAQTPAPKLVKYFRNINSQKTKSTSLDSSQKQ